MSLVGIVGKHNVEMVHPSMDKCLVKRVGGERGENLEMQKRCYGWMMAVGTYP